jgi:putative Mg2+ transporter-C (MgtC) family protein
MDAGNEFGFVATYLPAQIIAIRLLLAALFGAMIGF